MLGLFAWAAVAAQPAIARPSPFLFEGSTVVRIDCETKGGPTWGTAFYLGSGRYMTAHHVIDGSVCRIAGSLVSVEVSSETPDYALVRAAHYPKFRVKISCARLTAGETYITSGYAGTDRGAVTQSTVVATGVSDPRDRDTEVNGSLIEGQSGGPVMDFAGRVHAINIWREAQGAPLSGVVELADTVLCRDDHR